MREYIHLLYAGIRRRFDRTANACFKDAADLHAQLEEYGPAISRYEQVAEHSLSSALTKYSVKEYWLRAGLCALANSVRVFDQHNYFDTEVRYRILSQRSEI